MRGRKRLSVLGAFFVLFSFAAPAFSSTRFFSIHDFRPASGTPEYFSIHSTATLLPGQISSGLFSTYAYEPFQKGATGNRSVGIIDHLLTHFFAMGVGFNEWWEFNFDMPVTSLLRIRPILAPSTQQPVNETFEIGDLRVLMKFRLLDANTNRVGFAIVPFITAPIGNEDHYLADPKVTGGGKFVIDVYSLPDLKFTLNVGAMARQTVRTEDLVFGDLFLLGLGVLLETSENAALFLESTMNTPFGDFMKEKRTTPIEFDVGGRIRLGDTGLFLSGGAGMGIYYGQRSPRFRGVFNIEFRSRGKNFVPMEKEIRKNRFDMFEMPQKIRRSPTSGRK